MENFSKKFSYPKNPQKNFLLPQVLSANLNFKGKWEILLINKVGVRNF